MPSESMTMEDANIRFREYQVHPTLAPFVKCIWSVESDQAIFDMDRERILPDSCVELVFHFGDPFLTTFANGTNALQPQSFVVGQMKRFLEIEPAGRMGLIAVRFYARGAYLFFQRPLKEVAAGVVNLEDVWTTNARELTERVALATCMSERLQLIEETLRSLLLKHGRQDRAIDESLQIIEASCGQIRVAQLASHLGLSGRQLTRRFLQTVGVTPKEFARINRFLHVVRRLNERETMSLTETAMACGYFDQAHFNHEFREMAGMAPGEFFNFPNVVY
jgi:AraC-like DNA-binding protein